MSENLRLAFHGIWSHKMRSILTMLGIIIGIAAIIAIVSTIQGTNEQIKQNLIGSGNNSVVIQIYNGDYAMSFDYDTVPEGIPVVTEEIRAEIAALKEVQEVSLYTTRYANYNVFYGNSALDGGNIYGVDSHYFSVYGYEITRGRGFVEDDFTKNRKVIIMDETSASSLFQGVDPLDKTVEILGEPFTIIGICKQGADFTPVINSIEDYYTYIGNNSGKVFLPSSVWATVYAYDEPQNVVVRAVNTDSMTGAGQKAADILNSQLTVDESLSIKYKSEDLLEQARNLQELASATQLQLIWIASISLLVGGIGVMNIMLVSVTERIREIGLKKALGAKKKVILMQFLTEAAVLTSIGGAIGVFAGIGLAEIVSSIAQTPSSISIPFIIIGVLFSMLIGIIFGLLPAVKAANQNPIDALRQQ